ncbi:MAG: helix-hairpin-helix domain-containing protein [Gemmatimonadetes bacterium]|nr:helix-hairpin-helix domain-containing protein [Gemmatimonadota bacterium]
MSLTASESRALLVSGVLIVVATVARATLLRQEGEPWRSNLRRASADSLIAEARARLDADARRRTPLPAGTRLDLNRATEAELDRLPGVGPALAREIVHHREVHGAFVWLEDLERVPGVGAALLDRIRDRVALPSRPGHPGKSGAGLAGLVAARGGGGVSFGAPSTLLELNRATAEELVRIPGIGPKRAAQILAVREARGGFRSVDDLLEVPGIGPKTLARVRPFVRVSP